MYVQRRVTKWKALFIIGKGWLFNSSYRGLGSCILFFSFPQISCSIAIYLRASAICNNFFPLVTPKNNRSVVEAFSRTSRMVNLKGSWNGIYHQLSLVTITFGPSDVGIFPQHHKLYKVKVKDYCNRALNRLKLSIPLTYLD